MKKLIIGNLILIVIFLSLYSIPKAYVYNGHRFAGTSRNYYVNAASFVSNDSNTVTTAEVLNDVQLAATAWTTQTSANFKFIYAGTTSSTGMKNDGINTVFADPNTSPYGYIAETNWWYDGTGFLVDADIRVFITTVPWFTSGQDCAAGEWIYQILTHEFGHALSLAHSDVATATMHAGVSYCDTFEYSLDPDDITAINTIYGLVTDPGPSPSPSPTPAPTPQPVPIPPPPSGSYLTVRAYKLKGLQKVDLTWTGVTTSTVDVYRNNTKILNGTTNDGFQTDAINKRGGATYTYVICENGSAVNCTNSANATF